MDTTIEWEMLAEADQVRVTRTTLSGYMPGTVLLLSFDPEDSATKHYDEFVPITVGNVNLWGSFCSNIDHRAARVIDGNWKIVGVYHGFSKELQVLTETLEDLSRNNKRNGVKT